MSNKKYIESTVVTQLSKKSDLDVNQTKKVILELFGAKAKHDVGIKSKGKMDFLKNHLGYTHVWVKDFKDFK